MMFLVKGFFIGKQVKKIMLGVTDQVGSVKCNCVAINADINERIMSLNRWTMKTPVTRHDYLSSSTVGPHTTLSVNFCLKKCVRSDATAFYTSAFVLGDIRFNFFNFFIIVPFLE